MDRNLKNKAHCTSTCFGFVLFVLKEQMRGHVCLMSHTGISKDTFHISKCEEEKSKERQYFVTHANYEIQILVSRDHSHAHSGTCLSVAAFWSFTENVH